MQWQSVRWNVGRFTLLLGEQPTDQIVGVHFIRQSLISEQIPDAEFQTLRSILELCLDRFVRSRADQAQQQADENHSDSDVENWGAKHVQYYFVNKVFPGNATRRWNVPKD